MFYFSLEGRVYPEFFPVPGPFHTHNPAMAALAFRNQTPKTDFLHVMSFPSGSNECCPTSYKMWFEIGQGVGGEGEKGGSTES